MNVLICGGEKTVNIVESLKSRFASGGVNLIKEDAIADVEKVLGRGAYFDRALIMEPAWTNDGEMAEEADIRAGISRLCNLINQRCSSTTVCFFVATNEEMAKAAYEESIEINNKACIILKKQPYSVLFFADLITKNIEDIGEELKYRPVKEFNEAEEVKNNVNWSTEKIQEESIGFGEDLEKIKEISVNPSEFVESTTPVEDTQVEDAPVEDTTVEDTTVEETNEGENNGGEEANEGEGIQENNDYEPEIGQDEHLEINETESKEQGLEGEQVNEFTVEHGEAEEIIDKTEEVNETTMNKSNKRIGGLRGKIKAPKKLEIVKNNNGEIAGSRNESTGEQTDGGETELRAILNYYKNRGGSLVVTGAEGCGKSTIAFNLANIVCSLGYPVLVVDFDIKGRAQAYISKESYDSVNSYENNRISLLKAIGSSNGIGQHVDIVRPGLHVLTTGLAEEVMEYEDMADKNKLMRLDLNARANYVLTVYDMPFKMAGDYASNITRAADNILLVCDYSTWGMTKMMMEVTNIDSYDTQEEMFTRAKVCINKYNRDKGVFGRKMGTDREALIELDSMIKELVGFTPEFRMQDMSIVDSVEYNVEYDNCWFTKKQFSDTEYGGAIFMSLLNSIFKNSR